MMPRILVVEDDERDFYFLSKKLSDLAVTVERVTNGKDAIDLLSRKRYAVLLVNLTLTGMSGMAVIRWCRDQEILRGLPIYVVTGMENPKARAEAVAAGVDGFFSKPYSSDDNATLWRMIQIQSAQRRRIKHWRTSSAGLIAMVGQIVAIVGGVLQWPNNPSRILTGVVVVAMIVTAICVFIGLASAPDAKETRDKLED